MRPVTRPVHRAPNPAPVRPDPKPALEDALAEIARDVRVDPKDWLHRARVPGGGE